MDSNTLKKVRLCSGKRCPALKHGRRTNVLISSADQCKWRPCVISLGPYAFCTNGRRRPQNEARFIESRNRELEHLVAHSTTFSAVIAGVCGKKYSTFVSNTESISQSRIRVVSWRIHPRFRRYVAGSMTMTGRY